MLPGWVVWGAVVLVAGCSSKEATGGNDAGISSSCSGGECAHTGSGGAAQSGSGGSTQSGSGGDTNSGAGGNTNSGAGGSAHAGSGGAAPSACAWPSSLDGDAGSRETCHASRRYLSCALAGGVMELCATDGAASCEGASSDQCHDKCAAGEYVASCGGPGPGPIPDPPVGCRSIGFVPAGIAYYCCPCDG